MVAVTRQQVKDMKSNGDNVLLVNVLPAEQFRLKRIPGSVSAPVEGDDFVERVEQKAGSRDRKIIVYSAKRSCDASAQAAQRLEEAGFTGVHRFEGGLGDWLLNGERVESGALNEL